MLRQGVDLATGGHVHTCGTEATERQIAEWRRCLLEAGSRGGLSNEMVGEITEEGAVLLDDLVQQGDRWCHRRVITFDFVQERRGEWTVIVDFDVPEANSELLRPTRERLLVPLLTFDKRLLPPGDVETRDESGRQFSFEESWRGRLVAWAMLLAAAKRGGACATCAPEVLRRLTSTDTVVAHLAWQQVGALLHGVHAPADHPPSPHEWEPNEHSASFLMLARRLYRYAFLVLAFDSCEIGTRKIVTFSYDGALRVTPGWLERLGLAPLTIAPRAWFGGNAESYHMQVRPAERLTIVDSMFLYSYYSREPIGHVRGGSEDTQAAPYGTPVWALESADKMLTEAGLVGTEDGVLPGVDGALDSAGISERLLNKCGQWRWWGVVEGPADPMSAHVRCSGNRMPTMDTGREVYGVFRLYPQFGGAVDQFFWAGLMNFFFVISYVLGLQWGRLTPLLARQPEVVFILAALVAGFGLGLALSPREHVVTSVALRPWRYYVGALTLMTVGAPATSVWGWKDVPDATNLPVHVNWLWGELGLDGVFFGLLLVATIRPFLANTTGGRLRWRSAGLRARRSSYPRRRALNEEELALLCSVVPESSDVAESAKATQERTRKRRAIEHARVRKLEMIKRTLVWPHLVAGETKQLLDRGIPPAIRHGRSERSW